jgi:uncharacterized protein YndB with AHSA1/START domain
MSEIRNKPAALAPVIKSIFVDLPVDAAFTLFTAGFDSWWPLLTHSTGEEDAIECVLESRAGGRIYEVLKDGRQVDWGMVLDWDAPRKLAFSWHPGRMPETAQRVELTFQPEGGGTRVELVHSGWERLGDQAQARHEEYDQGWDFVLGQYVQQASTGGTTFL